LPVPFGDGSKKIACATDGDCNPGRFCAPAGMCVPGIQAAALGFEHSCVLRQSGADDAKRLRATAVKAERNELIRLWRENQISDEVLHKIEEHLDYQESRI